MSTEPREITDRKLWQSLAADREVASGAISDAELASWLEGRLSEVQAARIDAALSADPELRRTALELSDILGQPQPAAPQRLIVRAQALVGFEAERQTTRGFGSFLASLFPGGFREGLQRGAMASMAIVLAVAGFMMGGGLGDSYAGEKQHVQAKAAVSTDTLSELGDLFTDGN